MKNFLRFFSLTTASQVFLLVNQLLLLPLQLRIWGHATVAQWLVVVSIANLATIADLGLRNAGHAQLLAGLRGDTAAYDDFRDIWLLSRGLIVLLTLVLLAGQGLMTLFSGSEFVPYLAVMIISLALDTLFFVRGAWQDTLGRFAAIEVLFLGMVATRLAGSVIALVVFHASPAVLAWVTLLTSIGLVAAQSWYLPEPRSLALLAGGFQHFRWRSIKVVQFVVSDPAASWVRISLPVVVFGVITSPAFVTTYVAVRAIFGVARQILNQVARYASVHYVQRLENNRSDANVIAVRAILASTLIGAAVSCVAIADNGRMLRLWLGQGHVESASVIILSFAVTALGYGYVVAGAILMRVGNVVGVAKRHYLYLGFCGLFAIIVYYFDLTRPYLVLLAIQELLLSAMFVAGLGARIMYASILAFVIACGLLAGLTAVVRFDIGGIFQTMSIKAMIVSLMVGGIATVLMTLASIGVDFWFRHGRHVVLRRKIKYMPVARNSECK